MATTEPDRAGFWSAILGNESLVLAGLLSIVSLLAIGSVAIGVANRLEAISFVTGAICVWLTVKESVWNFPLGLANAATFSVVFYQSKLYADAGLQLVYFALLVAGWYLWLFGGRQGAALQVSRAPAKELGLLTALAAIATFGLWQVLSQYGGPASFWDALTTSLSLASQWLLNRKRLESWVGWILVDILYVPLYLSKDLYLTALLYVVFTVMAVVGLRAWRAHWRQQITGT